MFPGNSHRPTGSVLVARHPAGGRDPRHLYRKLLSNDASVERFLAETDLHRWHIREHDRGRRPMSETIPEMCQRFPAYATEIAVWHDRFMENIGGVIDGTVEVLD